MTTVSELEQQRALRERLQVIDTPEARADLQRLQALHLESQMSYLGQDVYSSAAGEDQPLLGWRRGSEDFDLLRKQVPELAQLTNQRLLGYFKPDESGFRAEIYLPDPEILGPGYKPTIAFKGSSGPIELADGKTRDTTLEDFAGINGPQTIGLRTDYYDRAMGLANDFRRLGVYADYTGHSLGGGLASAAVSVSGERAITFNAAPLHADTARDFAHRTPGAKLYDPTPLITAYQVQGELLSDGVVHNIDRLDAFHNRQLAEVMRHSSTILLNVPDEVREALKERVGEMMPAHARASFGAFVDQLANGDPDALLRDMPLAAGRVVPIRAMKRSDPDDPESPPVPRPEIPSLSGVSSFAAPLLDLAHREAQAARVGNALGEWVEIAGKSRAQSLDDTGDAVRGVAEATADVQNAVSRTMGHATAAGIRMSGEASAEVREFAGKVDATVDIVQAEVQARGASAGAGVLRRIGGIDILPDGMQRWASREAVELERAGSIARERNMAEARYAVRDAGQDANDIRENSRVVARSLETVVVTGSKHQHDATAYAGKSVDEVLEIASAKLAQVSGYAPAIGAVAFAGASLKANALMSHDDAADVGKSVVFGRLAIPSGQESFERHLNDTVVPSMEAELEAFESSLLAKYPSLSAPKKTREDDDIRQPGKQHTESHLQLSQMTEAGHSAHLVYLQAQSAMTNIEAAPGMGLTQHEKATLGASVVAEALSAKGWNFTGVDHVVPSSRIDPQTGRPETVFVVQGDLDSPAHRRIAVDVAQALSQSIEQSSAVAQSVQLTRQEALTQEQARSETKDVDGPKGPVMRIGPRTMSQPSDQGAGDGGGGE